MDTALPAVLQQPVLQCLPKDGRPLLGVLTLVFLWIRGEKEINDNVKHTLKIEMLNMLNNRNRFLPGWEKMLVVPEPLSCSAALIIVVRVRVCYSLNHFTEVTQYSLAGPMFSLVNILKEPPESRTMDHAHNPPVRDIHTCPCPPCSNRRPAVCLDLDIWASRQSPEKQFYRGILLIIYSHCFKYCYWKDWNTTARKHLFTQNHSNLV